LIIEELTMYQHILFATDLLETNYFIEEKLEKMQKLTDAKVSIIHVMEPLNYAYPVAGNTVFYDHQEIQDTLIENAGKHLLEVKERLNIPDANIEAMIGAVTFEILNYAKNNNVDLIVTGSHGKHGIKLLLGSTANGILHGASCDVLAVRITEEDLKSEPYLKGLKRGYENKIHGHLEGVSKEMDHLKFKASEFKEEVKMVYGQQVEQIRIMQTNTKDKLEELKEASADSWGSLKDGVDNAKKALSDSIKNLKDKFH